MERKTKQNGFQKYCTSLVNLIFKNCTLKQISFDLIYVTQLINKALRKTCMRKLLETSKQAKSIASLR